MSHCDGAWDEFVRAHPQGTFFHLSAWAGVVETAFGRRTHRLISTRGGALAAILPLVEVRSRLFGHALIGAGFTVGGGPLALEAEALQDVLDHAAALGRKLGADYVELRDIEAAGPGWVRRDGLYAGFERSIAPEEDDCLKQIPRKQRAVVRKALERGMTTDIDRSAADFFGLYARTMRDHGTPALPRRYFETLLGRFGPDCEVLTVRRDGQPVASVLSYYFRGRVLPYYTGSAPAARDLGANDLMYWSLMRHAAARGCAVFDFGRSKVGTGPYAFKRNWGFEPRPIAHHFRLIKAHETPNLNPTNPRFSLMIEAWRRLPLPVANAISPFISRSLG